jgi:hypothetical protein
MPVYLCKPGWDAPEPWRHGIQVYAYPFSIPEQPTTASSPSREGRSQSDDAEGASSPQREESSSSLAAQDGHGIVTTQHTTHHKGEVRTRGIKYGMPVRRVRHAEVVLVDQVSIHYGRYWLRLRWPGPHGGFAGFIALGLVPPQHAAASGPQPSCLPSPNLVPPTKLERHLNRMGSSYSTGTNIFLVLFQKGSKFSVFSVLSFYIIRCVSHSNRCIASFSLRWSGSKHDGP